MLKPNRKKYLFFFVHPSKYYLFRHTINYLKQKGHQVDIAIIKKDVLEDLVKQEGWEYVNIFPEGRRSKKSRTVSIFLVTLVNFFKTIDRLHKLTKNRTYSLFITDDCLSIIGWFKKTPVIMFIDDDFNVVKENALLYVFATKIISPLSTNLGIFNKKKISLKGYKELAYLNPDSFTPNREIVAQFNPDFKKYVLFRFVSMTASHDTNIKGLNDDNILTILNILNDKYMIYISSERPLKREFDRYRLKIKPELIGHVLYFADFLISDSQTMTSEAAVLGTPSLRFNDFVGRISSMEEKENRYGLTYGFKTNEFDKMLVKVEELMQMPDLKIEWQNRRKRMLEDMEDVNKFIINVLETTKNVRCYY
jgi:uncharacterized protein